MIEVIWTIYGLVWMCAPAPVAIKDNILYLLFGSAPLGSYAAVDGSLAFPYILHAWRSSPDV